MSKTTINRVAMGLARAHNQMKQPESVSDISAAAADPYWRALAKAAIDAMPEPRTELHEKHLRLAEALGEE